MDIETFVEYYEEDEDHILEYTDYGLIIRGDEHKLVVDLDKSLINPSDVLYPLFEENYEEVIYLSDKKDKIKKIIEDPLFIKRKDKDKIIYYNNGEMYSIENKPLLLKKTSKNFIHRWYKENNKIYLDSLEDVIEEFNSPEDCYNISIENNFGFYYELTDKDNIIIYNETGKIEKYEDIESIKEDFQKLRKPIIPDFINIDEFIYKIYDGKNKLYENNIKIDN